MPPGMETMTAITALEDALRRRGSALVAFSGGVDSAVVAALAQRALGERALAVTAAAETLTGRFSHALSMPPISFCRSNRSRLPSFFTTM